MICPKCSKDHGDRRRFNCDCGSMECGHGWRTGGETHDTCGECFATLRAENEALKKQNEAIQSDYDTFQKFHKKEMDRVDTQNESYRTVLVECAATLRNEWMKHKRDNGCVGDGDCGVKQALDQAEAVLNPNAEGK